MTLPTAQYRRGDFSAALGRSLGSDPLGRTVVENTVYDPASTQTVNLQLVRNPFPGNMIPARLLDPVALKIQSMIPLPQTTAVVNNYLEEIAVLELRIPLKWGTEYGQVSGAVSERSDADYGYDVRSAPLESRTF